MAGLKKNIIFYILLFIDFYIIPRFIKDTGSAVIVMLMTKTSHTDTVC